MALKSSNKKGKKIYKILSIISLIIVLVFISWFVYGKIWQIKKVDILNAKHTDIEILKNDIDNFLKQKSFFFIPNDHIVFLSKSRLENRILNTYPSVEEVSVSKNFDKEVIVKIKDRKAMGVWCDQNCYFFDDEGILFKKSFDFTGAIFATWTDNSSSTLKFYDKALCLDICIDKDFVSFLSKNKIKKVDIINEELAMLTEYGYSIKSMNNSTTTMRNMSYFLNKYEGSLNSLEYLDIRFTDKIFYKGR